MEKKILLKVANVLAMLFITAGGLMLAFSARNWVVWGLISGVILAGVGLLLYKFCETNSFYEECD